MPDNGKDNGHNELTELLEESHVALSGVEVLFAFLLAVPFSNGFADTSQIERASYAVAFLSAAIASILLIAPSILHRLRWREHDMEQLLQTSTRLAIAATAFLGIAMPAAVFLITGFLYGRWPAAAVAGGIAAAVVWFWYGLPLSRRGRGRHPVAPQEDAAR